MKTMPFIAIYSIRTSSLRVGCITMYVFAHFGHIQMSYTVEVFHLNRLNSLTLNR